MYMRDNLRYGVRAIDHQIPSQQREHVFRVPSVMRRQAAEVSFSITSELHRYSAVRPGYKFARVPKKAYVELPLAMSHCPTYKINWEPSLR